MATESQVIQKVRRRVGDDKPTRVFDNLYYQDAIGFGLEKLSHDLGETYLVVDDVPNSRVFLLVKLATIEMCYMRAAKESDATSEGDGEGGPIGSITVPDLSVSSATSEEAAGPPFWMKLAERLQEEYDNEIEQGGGQAQAAEVQTAYLRRKSLTTGGYRSKKLDPGLDAVTIVATANGSDVTITWDVLYSDLFDSYQVYRDTVSDMSSEERIAVIDDNQDTEYVDEDLAVGTYYYRVKTVNPNEIETNSNVESVTVV